MRPEVVNVPLADLVLDPANTRLGQEQPSQQAVYLALAKQQGRRLIKLAGDIVDYGLDPTTLVAVVPTTDRRKRYKVLEGNRRIRALKALETPSIVAPALETSDQRRLNELAARYSKVPIESVSCVLFENERDAYHWIHIRHTGANEGTGLVEWDANEKDRFRARHGGVATRKPAGQVIDFIAKIDGEDPSSFQGILTNIDRLISTREVREALGIDRVDGRLVSRYPANEVAKGLRKITNDLRSGKVKVKHIYYGTDRLKYIRTFAAEDLPNPDEELDEPVALDDLAEGSSRPASRPKKRSRSTLPRPKPVRTTLIPTTCKANVTHPRIRAIYNELLTLNVEQYPNSCAVLLPRIYRVERRL